MVAATIRIALLLVVVIWPALADDSPVAGTAATLDARFAAARDAARNGETDHALRELGKLMSEEPDNVDYLFAYGQTLYWSGRASDALPFFEKARQLAPGYEDVWEAEYRARRAVTAGPSLERFRQTAAQRFPDAGWHREPDEPPRANNRWVLAIAREYLDNGAPDWHRADFHYTRQLREGRSAGVSVSRVGRFASTDTQFGATANVDLGEHWAVSAMLATAPESSFLPETSVDLGISRRLAHGWVVGARWRLRDYSAVEVDSLGLVTERYFGRYRIAYSVDRARLFSERAAVHTATGNYYADSGFRLGLVVAAGEEIEATGPGRVLRTDVNAVALVASHPITELLRIGWSLSTHKQGDFFRRNAIALSISRDF